jgi:hypothetical protein
MQKKKWVYPLFALTFNPLNAEAGVEAGRVMALNCQPKAFKVVRGNQSVDMRIWLSLETGDKIHWRPALKIKDTVQGKRRAKNRVLKLANLRYAIQSPGKFRLKKADCETSLYRVIRNGKTLPLTTRVQNGDHFDWARQATVLTFKADNEQNVALTGNDFPYTVKQVGNSATVKGNLLDWAISTLTFWRKKEIDADVRNIQTGDRGEKQEKTEKIEVPALDSPMLSLLMQPQLVAGQRALFIGWRGGKAQYQLDILPVGKASIFSGRFDTRFAQTSPLNLSAGQYELVISVADTKVSEHYSFTVVASHPAYPAELVDDSIKDEKMLVTLRALWLAAQKEGFKQPWLFEAYQLVAGIAENYSPALVARDAILARRKIKKRLPKQ